ncbi:MAG: NAD(+)/NADH kinase [Deltaproteobacteria bacterium]|nr:NAD(+)/NADH kinase [Deltaproteobacteria bacterium]
MRTLSRTRATLEKRSRTIQIVVTPGSGNGRALNTARRLDEELRARGHPAGLEVFSDRECLRRWATKGDAKFSLLVSVGGDGTQDTAAVAAVRRSVPFLSVPYGFGNLFARALGHSHRVDEVVDALEYGELVSIDVGVRNGELFLCQKSYGLLAQIENEVGIVGRPRVRRRRDLAYYRMAVQVVRPRSRPMRRDVGGPFLFSPTAGGAERQLLPDRTALPGPGRTDSHDATPTRDSLVLSRWAYDRQTGTRMRCSAAT